LDQIEILGNWRIMLGFWGLYVLHGPCNACRSHSGVWF
jgi:hypothetical protein